MSGAICCFNGGKDSVVLLHILRMSFFAISHPDSNLLNNSIISSECDLAVSSIPFENFNSYCPKFNSENSQNPNNYLSLTQLPLISEKIYSYADSKISIKNFPVPEEMKQLYFLFLNSGDEFDEILYFVEKMRTEMCIKLYSPIIGRGGMKEALWDFFFSNKKMNTSSSTSEHCSISKLLENEKSTDKTSYSSSSPDENTDKKSITSSLIMKEQHSLTTNKFGVFLGVRRSDPFCGLVFFFYYYFLTIVYILSISLFFYLFINLINCIHFHFLRIFEFLSDL